MASEQFPLLHLPSSAVSCVLRRITDEDAIIALYTISNRTKAAVKAINFTIPHMELMLDKQSWIQIHLSCIIHWNLRKRWNDIWNGSDDINEPLCLCRGSPDYRKEGYTLKRWLKHFLEISKNTELDVFILNKPQEEVNLDGLRQHIGSVRGIRLNQAYDLAFQEKVLANFPTTKRFHVSSHDTDILSNKIVTSNFDLIHVEYSHLIKLDDLLSMNAKIIQLNDSAFTDTDINRFLKAWKTGSCSRLKALIMKFTRQPNLQSIFRGTGFQNAPAQRVNRFEIFNLTSKENLEVTFVGGQDVRGKNGKIGTVAAVPRMYERMEITFYVWE